MLCWEIGFYDFIKISRPIVLIHRDGTIPICTHVTFEHGLFQRFKLRRIVEGNYLARIVAFRMVI